MSRVSFGSNGDWYSFRRILNFFRVKKVVKYKGIVYVDSFSNSPNNFVSRCWFRSKKGWFLNINSIGGLSEKKFWLSPRVQIPNKYIRWNYHTLIITLLARNRRIEQLELSSFSHEPRSEFEFSEKGEEIQSRKQRNLKRNSSEKSSG